MYDEDSQDVQRVKLGTSSFAEMFGSYFVYFRLGFVLAFVCASLCGGGWEIESRWVVLAF